MRLIDFEFNGERLSDYMMTIANFDSLSEIKDIANLVTINNIKSSNSNKYISVGYSYDDVLQVDFQVCKDTCKTPKNLNISDIELNRLMRWLNRKSYGKFKPIYDDISFMNTYFEGTFNVQPIYINGNIVGLSLSFRTNAPYGFIEPLYYNFEFKSLEDEFTIFDISDEVGHLYCNVTITCLEAGDLIIKNSLDEDNDVVIKNCQTGEVITMQGEQKIIMTSRTSHDTLPNDFNYNFFRINNYYDNTENVYTSSLNCIVEIVYSPIRKVGIIV